MHSSANFSPKLSLCSKAHAWVIIFALLAVELPKFLCLCLLDVYVTLPLIPSEISGRDAPIKSSRPWLIAHWLSAVLVLALGVHKQLFLLNDARLSRVRTVTDLIKHLNAYGAILKKQILSACLIFTILIVVNINTLGSMTPQQSMAVNGISSGLMLLFLAIEYLLFKQWTPFDPHAPNEIASAQKWLRWLAISSMISMTILMAPVWGSLLMVFRAEYFVFNYSPVFLDRLTFLTSHPLLLVQFVWMFIVTIPFACALVKSIFFRKAHPN